MSCCPGATDTEQDINTKARAHLGVGGRAQSRCAPCWIRSTEPAPEFTNSLPVMQSQARCTNVARLMSADALLSHVHKGGLSLGFGNGCTARRHHSESACNSSQPAPRQRDLELVDPLSTG
eukprot:978302-Rhodomonas_salina.2